MRVVVTGATGNVGSAVMRELAAAGHELVGGALARPTLFGRGRIPMVPGR